MNRPAHVPAEAEPIRGYKNWACKDGSVFGPRKQLNPTYRNGVPIITLTRADGSIAHTRVARAVALALRLPIGNHRISLKDPTKPATPDNISIPGQQLVLPLAADLRRIPAEHFYSNIGPSHATEKCRVLPRILYKDIPGDCDGIVVEGAQFDEDICQLIMLAKAERIPIYLIDIRPGELERLKQEPYYYDKAVYLMLDISKTHNQRALYTLLKAHGIKNPLIYDNLCGGFTRFKNIDTILEIYPRVVFYLNSRWGTPQKLKKRYRVPQMYSLGSNQNFLAIVEKK